MEGVPKARLDHNGSSFAPCPADNLSDTGMEVGGPGSQENGIVCPHLEKSDPRCAAHLNLRNIMQAFSHCAGRHRACPVYQKLRASTDRHEHTHHHTATFAFLAAS